MDWILVLVLVSLLWLGCCIFLSFGELFGDKDSVSWYLEVLRNEICIYEVMLGIRDVFREGYYR